jgi:hypothetical protein
VLCVILLTDEVIYVSQIHTNVAIEQDYC